MPALAPGFGEPGGKGIGRGNFAHPIVGHVDNLLIFLRAMVGEYSRRRRWPVESSRLRS